jgi:hypothetical protein
MTVKQLRFILSEAVGNEIDIRIAEFTRNIINVSEKFVNSLVADTRDAAAAKQLQKLSTDAASYAKWLLGRREPKGEQFAMLTKLCGDLAASSGFWSTPSFSENIMSLYISIIICLLFFFNSNTFLISRW